MRKHSFFSFVSKILIITVSFVTPIALLSSSNGFELLYLTKNNKLQSEDGQKVEIVYRSSEEESSNTNISTSGFNSGTSGNSNLNLALISKLNEGYIKELLSVYASLSNGELTDYDYHVSVEALLGMQLVETGYYGATVGKIPKSYLPYDENGVIWNRAYNTLSASEMKLANFGDAQWAKYSGDVNALCSWAGDHYIGTILVRSPFQIESQLTLPANVSNSSFAGRVDQHLFANLLAWVDSQYNSMLKTNNIKVEELSQFQLDCLASTTHNRGSSAARIMPYGITYDTSGSLKTKVSAEYNTTDKYAYDIIASSFSEYMKRDSIGDMLKLLNPESPKWAAMAIACHDDWFFTETLRDYAEDHLDQLHLAWSILYPEENVTKDYCMQQVNTKTATLPTAILKVNGKIVSTQDTLKVYGTASDFSEGNYNSRGYMFKVTQERSSKYTNKYSDGSAPYIVASYEILTAGHNFSCSVLGSYWYAYLLKLGGLTEVDPTNPNTYINNLTGGLSGNIPSQFSSLIDNGTLSESRSKLLQAAYSQVNLAGYWYGHLKENEYFDCSRFIMWCYSKIGVNISFTTGSLYNSLAVDAAYYQINLSDAKPGDLLLCNGHVMMFITYKDGKIYAIDCGGAGNDGVMHPATGKVGVRYGFRGNIKVEISTDGTHQFFSRVSGAETMPDGSSVIALNDSNRYYKLVRVAQLDTMDAQEQSTYLPQSLLPSFNTITGARMSLTDTEMLLMYKIVAAEAEGECFEGKAAVAEVIFNRVNDSRFPSNIHDVIYAPNQFSPVSNGSIETKYPNCSQSEKQNVEKAVNAALNNSNYSEGALFFRTQIYTPGRTPIKQIGSHFFSK